MADIVQEIQGGESAVTREPKERLRGYRHSVTQGKAQGSGHTGNFFSHSAPCGRALWDRERCEPGNRAKGRGAPGARRPSDHKGGMRRDMPAAPNLGVSLQRSHLESDQFSGPPAPLPPAVSSHPTPSSKNTAEAEKFLTTPTATVSHWQGKTELRVRVPPSCPAEGRRDCSATAAQWGRQPTPLCQPLPLQGQRVTLKRDGDRLVRIPRHQHPGPYKVKLQSPF